VKSVLIIMTIILVQTVTFAQDIGTSKQKARSIGQGLLGKVQGSASSSIEGNKDLVKGLNYKGTSSTVLPQKNMNSEQLKGEAELMKKGSKEGELIEKGFMNREDYDTNALRKDLDIAKDAQKNPERYIGDLLSQSKECEQIDKEDITSKTKEACDEYVDWKDNNCKVGQVVKVDAKHDYKCKVTREKREGVCNKKLRAWCDGGVRNCGYNAGGIEEGSVDTGIEWDYTYPYLRLGSKTGDWHFHGHEGSCDKTVQRARFKVKDINNVKKFILSRISYDDHAMVKINGVRVHNTLGGYYLEITNRWYNSDRPGRGDLVISSGSGSGPCWRLYPGNGQNHYDYVGKDVQSYLREGWNDVEVELVYSWEGQVNVVFEAEQYCCTVKEEWDDECERLKP
jgi:hypothetical protein